MICIQIIFLYAENNGYNAVEIVTLTPALSKRADHLVAFVESWTAEKNEQCYSALPSTLAK